MLLKTGQISIFSSSPYMQVLCVSCWQQPNLGDKRRCSFVIREGQVTRICWLTPPVPHSLQRAQIGAWFFSNPPTPVTWNKSICYNPYKEKLSCLRPGLSVLVPAVFLPCSAVVCCHHLLCFRWKGGSSNKGPCFLPCHMSWHFCLPSWPETYTHTHTMPIRATHIENKVGVQLHK